MWNERTEKCPKCQKSDQVIPIMFGFPGPEMLEAAERGEIKLGGCCISPGTDPEFHCKRCDYDFPDFDAQFDQTGREEEETTGHRAPGED